MCWIKHIDCMDKEKGLPSLKNKSIDLCLTDPPYGIKIGKNGIIGGAGKIGGSSRRVKPKQYIPVNWDDKGLSQEQFKEIKRVSKNQVIFGYNYFVDILGSTRCFIVWDKKKRNDWNDNFSDCELIYTSYNKPAKVFHYLWMGALKEKPEERYHPTQKPLMLIEWILKHFKPKSVIDPFMGSGTTAEACINLDIPYYGYEKELGYKNIINKRIERSTKIKNEDQKTNGLF